MLSVFEAVRFFILFVFSWFKENPCVSKNWENIQYFYIFFPLSLARADFYFENQ